MTSTRADAAIESTVASMLRDLQRSAGIAAYLGVDLVDVSALERQLRVAGQRLAARWFTLTERNFCAGDGDRLASTLAGKEAVAKALGTGMRAGVRWTDIEILREPGGQPWVRLTGGAEARADALDVQSIAISLSHEGPYAVAVALGLPTGSRR